MDSGQAYIKHHALGAQVILFQFPNLIPDLGEGIDEAVLQGVVEDRFWTGAPKATKIRS